MMFWKTAICLVTLQINYVICYGGCKGTSSCTLAYSKLENLCYEFTGKAGDYFSVQDIHQRDGYFAVREASLYVAYNACGKITRSIDNYRTGEDLEKNKVTGGANNNSSPGGASGQTPSPIFSPPPTPTTTNSQSPPSGTSSQSPPTGGPQSSPSTPSSTPTPTSSSPPPSATPSTPPPTSNSPP